MKIFETPWRKWCRRLAAVAMLGVAGVIISPVGNQAAEWQRENQIALNAAELDGAVGQGILLGVFGGFRSVLADFAWVRSYVYWEKRDRAGCESMMRLAMSLDPGNAYFWLNAADVIAYDMAHWEIQTREGVGEKRLPLDPLVKEAIYREYAKNGVALLEKAAARARDQSQFFIRAAQITASKLKDIEGAATFYRKAAECPRPQWFAGVIYIRILEEELGRKKEAYAWCRQYYEKISRELTDDPLQMKELFREILTQLEAELAAAP